MFIKTRKSTENVIVYLHMKILPQPEKTQGKYSKTNHSTNYQNFTV